MASIKTVERKIGNIEGFDIRFKHPDGRDVRSDMANIPGYPFERAARGNINVAAGKEQRFRASYPGFDCEVLDSGGNDCHGAMLLSNVRETYYD